MTLDEFKKLTLPASLRTVAPSRLGLEGSDAPVFPAGTHVHVKLAIDTANDSVSWMPLSPDLIAVAICDGWSWRSLGGYCVEADSDMDDLLPVLEPVELAPPTENASW